MSAITDFRARVALIVDADPRYAPRAYEFVSRAVSYTMAKLLEGEKQATKRHISGRELCDGIRELALKQYGAFAYDVLGDWGVHRTVDLGEIVFKLVNNGLLGASEDDSPEDFVDVFDFDDVFLRPFIDVGHPPEHLQWIA